MNAASVIITTKNRREELLKAVESAMGQQGLLEVIVIDDGSTDGTAEELKKKFSVFSFQSLEEQPTTSDSRFATAPEAPSPITSYSQLVTTGFPILRLIRHDLSAGYIVRRNEGARVAKGDVIFSLDDDAVFSSPLVVEQTLWNFSHPRIGAVAIPYIEPRKANTEMQRAPTGEDIWITASYIGTAHAVRRDVFLALGGYRAHLVHQGEERDFCIRMLAAELKNGAGLTTEHTEGTEEEAVLTTIEHGGRCEIEQPQVGPKGEGVGTTESKDTESTEGGAGPCLDKPSGASESDSLVSELADAPVSDAQEALYLDAGRWTLDSAPLSAVPGFFVRLGNSDVIIHNESPKRDYSRMDFYGRRNDVLFHWQNTPMPDLLWQLPKTIAGGLVCAAKVGRWRKMLEGIVAGFLAIAGGVKRDPISKSVAGLHKNLKRSPQKV